MSTTAHPRNMKGLDHSGGVMARIRQDIASLTLGRTSPTRRPRTWHPVLDTYARGVELMRAPARRRPASRGCGRPTPTGSRRALRRGRRGGSAPTPRCSSCPGTAPTWPGSRGRSGSSPAMTTGRCPYWDYSNGGQPRRGLPARGVPGADQDRRRRGGGQPALRPDSERGTPPGRGRRPRAGAQRASLRRRGSGCRIRRHRPGPSLRGRGEHAAQLGARRHRGADGEPGDGGPGPDLLAAPRQHRPAVGGVARRSRARSG